MLGFIPMVKVHYMLACREDSLEQDPIRELVELLRGPHYSAMIEPLPGYALDRPGTIETVEAVMARSEKPLAGPSAHRAATSPKSSNGGRRRATAAADRDD